MKWFIVCFFVVVLVVILINIPLLFKCNSIISLNKKIFATSINFFVLNLLSLRLKITKNNKVKIETNKNLKLPKITKFSSRFFKNIINEIMFKEINVLFSGGVKNDAFKTSILCGRVNVLTSEVFKMITYKNKKAKLFLNSIPNFNDDDFEMIIDVKINITIFNIIKAFVLTIFKRWIYG